MNTTAAIVTIIGTSVGVLVAILGLLASSRKSAEKTFDNGRKSRDDEVALLRSQRDDARRERDEQTRRADRLQERVDAMIDRRGGRE